MSRVGRRGASDGLLEVRVERDDLGDLVKAINRHATPKEVKKELRAALRAAVKPMVPKARGAVLGQPSKGRGGKLPSLRADMARAVEVKVDLGGRNPGVRLRLNGRKLRGRPPGLVAMYEGTIPWRHPVFGTGTWAAQAHRGFLTEVGRAGEPEVARDIGKAMDDIGKAIDK